MSSNGNDSQNNSEANDKVMRIFVCTVCACMLILTGGCVAWMLL